MMGNQEAEPSFRHPSRALRLRAAYASILLRALHDSAPVLLSLRGHRVLSDHDVQGDPNPTALHCFIDGREGILLATNMAAKFNLLVVLENLAEYRQWPHPSSREMVRILARDTSTGPILFRRQLPPGMLLIDHALRFNLFPRQHLVQKRGAILEARYRIFGGFWFSVAELIMTALFHFEDKIHRKNLSRVEAIPLLFLRLLSQVLEHFGFPTEP